MANKYYPHIFEPIKINGVTIPNRIVMSPMGDTLGMDSGECSPRQIAYYTERAKGGVGLIQTSYCAVSPAERRGIAHEGQMHCYKLSHMEALQQLAESVHQYDTKIFVQLHHPGNMALTYLNGGLYRSSGTMPPFTMQETLPANPLSVEQIHAIVKDFGDAAYRCWNAGIDGVLLHGAHGYLLDQFLMPFFNKRTDEYGGSLENRCRIIVEIIKEIRSRVPASFPIAMRVDNACSALPQPWTHENAVEAIRYIQSVAPVDAIDLSTLDAESMQPWMGPGVGVRAEWHKKWMEADLGCVIYGVNDIENDPADAEKALANGELQLVSIGRQLIADSMWVEKARQGRQEDIRPCLRCCECMHNYNKHIQVRCQVNPTSHRELDVQKLCPATAKKNVVVIGAGPAGCEAALKAAEDGHKVTLLEKSDKIGGTAILASMTPNKKHMKAYVDYLGIQVRKANIDVHFGVDGTDTEAIAKFEPDVIIVAAGAADIRPASIPGINNENVYLAKDVVRGDITFSGKRCVVIGGHMTGLETAEMLAFAQNAVSIYDMAPELGDDIQNIPKRYTLGTLQHCQVGMFTRHKLVEIKADSVVFENLATGETVEAPADAVILAMGTYCDNKVYNAVREAFSDVVIKLAGDSSKPGPIMNATSSGYWKAANI